VQAYLKQNYGYEFCSSYIQVKAPGITKQMLANAKEIADMQRDIEFELTKFGKVANVTIPNPLVPSCKEKDLGSFYIHFTEVASAFTCYNLLN
jgi:hypothetical protein